MKRHAGQEAWPAAEKGIGQWGKDGLGKAGRWKDNAQGLP